jgi:hypothetical protein
MIRARLGVSTDSIENNKRPFSASSTPFMIHSYTNSGASICMKESQRRLF